MGDFSLWVRGPKPQEKGSADADVAMDDTAQDAGNGPLGRNTDSDSSRAESASYKDMSASPPRRRSRSRKPSNRDTLSPPYQPYRKSGFYIDLPYLSDKEDYEHLPDYFNVDKILREVTPEQYLVKLKSGEVDLVSMPPSHYHVLPTCLSAKTHKISLLPRTSLEAQSFLNV